jgi:hypothetical protein
MREGAHRHTMGPARRTQVPELLPADGGNKPFKGTRCALALLFEGAETEGSSGPVEPTVTRPEGISSLCVLRMGHDVFVAHLWRRGGEVPCVLLASRRVLF